MPTAEERGAARILNRRTRDQDSTIQFDLESPRVGAYPLPVPPRETYLQLFRLTCPHPDCRRVNTGRALVTAAGPKFAAEKLLRTKLKCKFCGGTLDQATEISLYVEVASASELKSWK